MMNYINTIKIAILVFPLIALLFTIPFILHQYHKYGSIHKFRVFIIYSFILYMLIIYFLVILPLPSLDEVVENATKVKLIPFGFIKDFIRESSFVLTEPSTYLKAIKEPCFYTVVFNIFMTIPFGMYLRYYFKCSLKKTILFSFLLSLFFEITQLTGLYFIYPYPYRIFDVDDLIMNTLGGVLGFYIMGLTGNYLPTREQIDYASLEEGKKVSGLRRLTLFYLDLFIYTIIAAFSSLLLRQKYISLIIFIIYYIIYPYLSKGQTLGGEFLNVKIEYPNHKLLRLTSRIIFIYLYYFKLPFLLFLLISHLKTPAIPVQIRVFMSILLILGTIIFYLINSIIILKGKGIFYDHLLKVDYKSTIKEINNCESPFSPKKQ